MDDILQALSPFFLLILVIVLIIGAVRWLGNIADDLAQSTNERMEAKKRCFEAGYPKLKWAGGEYYCYKWDNGTEQIIPLREVE